MSGCTSTGAIFNHQNISGTSITTMDARQRAIIANRLVEAKTDLTFVRICAEPFPDIFTVVSSSLSAGFNVKATTEAEKIANAEIGAQLAKTLSESGAAIERSQTVNLLNNSMYRTCERYLSGAIDSTELTIQAIRDQKAMVSILAIEQLTNIARPSRQPIILHSSPVEASLASVLPKTIENAKEQLNVATKNREENALKKIEAMKGSKKEGVCEFNEDEKDKKEACDKALKSLNVATTEEGEAKIFYNHLLALSALPITAKSSGGQTLVNPAGEVKVNNLDTAAITKIADTVLALAKLGASIDPYESCLFLAQSTYNNSKKESKDDSELQINRRDCKDLLMTPNDDNAASEDLQNKSIQKNTIDGTIYKLYVQSLKNCSGCAELAKKANQEASALDNKFALYPVEYMDIKYMPSQNEVRYFDAASKVAAEKLAKKLGAEPKVLSLKNASKNLIEVWIVKPEEVKKPK